MKSLVNEASHIASDQQTRKSLARTALLCSGIEQGIEKLSLFEDVVLQASFENETGSFQYARRCRIVRKNLRRDSAEWKIFETEIREHGHRFSHDAAAPELLA